MNLLLLTGWLLLISPIARADDPFVGEWRMQPSASMYAGEIPTAMRIVIESTADGVHYVSETTQANLRIVSAEYTADYDGRLAPVMGDAGLLAPVSLSRIDANTVEATYIRGLQIVATSRRVVSADQRTMTITTVTYDAQHRPLTNIGIYERVER